MTCPGTSYGHCFHHLLLQRGLLLLGLYRPVCEGGQSFYAVITNPPYVSGWLHLLLHVRVLLLLHTCARGCARA